VRRRGPVSYEHAQRLGVDFNFSQIKRRAMDLGATADQIPYIMATTLDMAAENTRLSDRHDMAVVRHGSQSFVHECRAFI
jgi:hypothetical protein